MPDSIDIALARLGSEHRAALTWFVENEESVGRRPLGERVAGLALTAYRGIHVPSGWRYALSIYQSHSAPYEDLPPSPRGDGTWVYLYKAHSGADGVGLKSPWNRGLYNCGMDRVPVGVFQPLKSRSVQTYRVLGLAFVEDYLPETETFILHGPLRPQQPVDLWGTLDPIPEQADVLPDFVGREAFRPYETADQRTRVLAEVVRRERQDEFRELMLSVYGKACAVTGFDAPAALEAAHIVPYRGRSSHSPSNGLLLRADLHRLFDRHLITVDPEKTALRVAPPLHRSKYGDLEKVQLRLPGRESLRPDPEALELHQRLFAERWR